MNSLDLSKSANLFAADQTPTPTRLIKNCEEVGLFEDLRHVNPFDKSFDRAVQLKEKFTAKDKNETSSLHTNEDSLHTPQVFPQDLVTPATAAVAAQGQSGNEIAARHHNDKSISPLDVPVVGNSPTTDVHASGTTEPSYAVAANHNQVPVRTAASDDGGDARRKYRHIAPASANKALIHLTTPIELPAPQVFTLMQSMAASPSTHPTGGRLLVSAVSLTPTKPAVQLGQPISATQQPLSAFSLKERLKMALRRKTTSGDKQVASAGTSQQDDRVPSTTTTTTTMSSDRCNAHAMARHREAAKRYRRKMRQEYNDLRQRNSLLEMENSRLRERVRQLENGQLMKQFADSGGACKQLHVAPSSVHLVMNIPQFQLVVPAASVTGQPAQVRQKSPT